jgi:hypothetical protein
MSSVAVLIVAIPRGISSTVQTSQDPPSTSVPLVKGTTNAFATIVDASDKTTAAIPLGNGCWLVSSAELEDQLPKWITTSDGERIEVSTVGEVDGADLLVVKSLELHNSELPSTFNAVMSDAVVKNYHKYRVMDTSTNALFSIAPSLTMTTTTRDIPIMTPAPIQNLAVVVDEIERIVGVVVRRGYSTWMLGKETLASIMDMTYEE